MNDITKVRRSKAPSALTWTHMTAGEFMIDLQDFFFSRHERIRMEQLSRNYAALNEKSHKLYELIKNSLPEEGTYRHYLLELSNAYTGMEVETQEYAYRQGFSDGVKFIMQTLLISGQ